MILIAVPSLTSPENPGTSGISTTTWVDGEDNGEALDPCLTYLKLLIITSGSNDSLYEGLSDKILHWSLLLCVGNAREPSGPVCTGNGETIAQELVF